MSRGMGQPPAKRQKRQVVLSSDDEDGDITGNKSRMSNLCDIELDKPVSARTQGRPAPAVLHQPISQSSSASSSPKKPRKKKTADARPSDSKDIYSFFNPITQSQRSAPVAALCKEEEVDDILQDDISDAENARAPVSSGVTQSIIGATARKKQGFTFSQVEKGTQASNTSLSASQKFLKPTKIALGSNIGKKPVVEDARPWAERFGPINLEELAVHDRKVAEIRSWLDSVYQRKSPKRLLVLKGPAGTGKTTTLSLLAKELKLRVTEWRNPVGSELASEGYQSLSAQFEEFLGRGAKFGGLELAPSHGKLSKLEQSEVAEESNQVLLIEEFPNNLSRSSSQLQSFRSSILQYLATVTPSLGTLFESGKRNEPVIPVVMIVSETHLSNTSRSDSFTAHRLLGPDILSHKGLSMVDFNPIAPTYLTKALELILQKESRKSGRKRAPGPLVLKQLGDVGDIRSAVGALEFLCVRGDTDGDWGSRISFGKQKRSAKEGVPLTAMEEESLKLVSQRESALGIFHAVGRVVYNKREDPPSSVSIPQPPNHLPHQFRPKLSSVSTDELFIETGTDIQTFVAALHENYIMSCSGPSNEDTLDSINGCLDALSDSDILCPDSRNRLRSDGTGSAGNYHVMNTLQGTAGDTLRQDEMSFHVAVQGILFSLPHPVKRIAMTGTVAGGQSRGGVDAFRMFYPASLRLWKQAEEVEQTINHWTSKIMSGGQLLSISPIRSSDNARLTGVASWQRNDINNRSQGSPGHDRPGFISRGEAILERLPYLVKMHRRKDINERPPLKQLESATTFHGFNELLRDGSPEDDDEDDFATPGGGVQPRQRAKGQGKAIEVKSEGGFTDAGFGVDKLMLSDDDIED